VGALAVDVREHALTIFGQPLADIATVGSANTAEAGFRGGVAQSSNCYSPGGELFPEIACNSVHCDRGWRARTTRGQRARRPPMCSGCSRAMPPTPASCSARISCPAFVRA
jgi:hypothetical protein